MLWRGSIYFITKKTGGENDRERKYFFFKRVCPCCKNLETELEKGWREKADAEARLRRVEAAFCAENQRKYLLNPEEWHSKAAELEALIEENKERTKIKQIPRDGMETPTRIRYVTMDYITATDGSLTSE